MSQAFIAAAAARPWSPSAQTSGRRAGLALRAGLVTDDSVPEGHRGLHAALYGASSLDAEAAHRASGPPASLPGNVDGTELLDIDSWLEEVRSCAGSDDQLRQAVGLFALYDGTDAEAPTFVGFSRRVPADVARHQAVGGARFARIRLLSSEPRMWTRAVLEERRRSWAEELGVSPGTAAGGGGGGGGREKDESAAAVGMTAAEFEAYEERKWKMQMAMGQNLNDGIEGEAETDTERRRNFIRAVEGDDWSAVIGEQSAETDLNLLSEVAAPPSRPPLQASPFARRGSKNAGTSTADISRELTVENVRAVLEAVRPILIADGGDIEVIGVSPERGAVMLGLMGACQSCPAAPETMESGVEKALLDHFGHDVLKEVVRVDQGAADLGPDGVQRRVEAHLGELRDALQEEGGHASVSDCSHEGCRVEVAGKPMLRELVRASLSHRFPELRNELVEVEAVGSQA